MRVFLSTVPGRLSLTGYNCKDDTFQFAFPRPKELPPDGKISVGSCTQGSKASESSGSSKASVLKKMLVDRAASAVKPGSHVS